MKSKKVFQMIAMVLIVSILSCKKDSTTGSNPKVVSTNPAGNVTGVPRNNGIAFTFSEPMDSSTINNSTFTLKQGSTVVPGTVSYSRNYSSIYADSYSGSRNSLHCDCNYRSEKPGWCRSRCKHSLEIYHRRQHDATGSG